MFIELTLTHPSSAVDVVYTVNFNHVLQFTATIDNKTIITFFGGVINTVLEDYEYIKSRTLLFNQPQ